MFKDNYCSYLLRLWKSERLGQPVWQAELENICTGERRCFTLEDLLVFLRARYIGQDAADPPDRSEGGEQE